MASVMHGSHVLLLSTSHGEPTHLQEADSFLSEFNVSRTTIRNLVRLGLVEIRRGRGTFVAAPRIIQELTELTGFVEDMRVLGRHATARLLQKKVDAVARQLALPRGTNVVQILRVRLADGVSFDETYLPEDLGQRVITNDLVTEPIFKLLEQKYSTPLLEAAYQLEASGIADTAVAMALSVSPGSPIFLIERTSYSVGHRPVDYEKLHYRGDHIRFKTRLMRRAARRPQNAHDEPRRWFGARAPRTQSEAQRQKVARSSASDSTNA